MTTLTLSQTDARRLERLANEARRAPEDVLKYVLRDGFDATEYAIKTVKERMQSTDHVSHRDTMQGLLLS